ncbi:CPBP family intramembrane metalloprotease [Candidatus Shapirobacteria bacterium]|nr:CPBP family intramembrane metalloprotease [Candidatus Shapirobacteria bacterium]
MSFIIAFIVFLTWSFYRLAFPESLYLDEFLLKPLIWLLPIYLITKFKNLGFVNKKVFQNILIGLGVGLVFSLERLFTKHFEFQSTQIFLTILVCLATALTEEIFFRGFLLNRWLKFFKPSWLALIANGLFFTFTHLPLAIFQLHYSGYDLLTYCISNFVSGFVDIYLFFVTGSIYAPIANHFVWNVFSTIFR